MSRRRHGLPLGVIVSALVAALLLAIQPHPALGAGALRQHCTAIDDPDVQATAAQTTPSLTSFPVIVHYMKHKSEPTRQESKIQRTFPVDTLKRFFGINGDFNRVWWQQEEKIQFVLVGVETCTYELRLFPELAQFGEARTLPNPTAPGFNMPRFFNQVGKGYNVRRFALADGLKPFRGLDLYLWPDIGGGIGGFARSSAAVRAPSVWLAPDCKSASSCDTMFAHEVAHFFGLCHVCTNAPPERVPRTCKQTCMLPTPGNRTLKNCEDFGNQAALMADRGGTKLEDCEVTFVVRNATAILTP